MPSRVRTASEENFMLTYQPVCVDVTVTHEPDNLSAMTCKPTIDSNC